MDRYRRNKSAVFALKYHLVWCPKYRRPVLVDEIASRLDVVLRGIAEEMDASVIALEVMPDHVHLFLESDPRFGVAAIMTRLKGKSSRIMRDEFPSLRSRLPTLWTRSYFAGTVGQVSEATVRRYIANQKGV